MPQNPSDSPRRSAGRRRWLRRVLLLVVPVLVLAGGGYVYLAGGRYVGTENAYVKANKLMVASEVSGVITEVPVRENQHVATGDVLFRLDDRQYRIALDEATAQLAGVRDDIAGLKAAWRQKREERTLAQTNLAFAEKEFKRQASLRSSGVTSHSKFDAARHDVDVARQQVRIIDQAIDQLRAQLAGDPDAPVERHPRYRAALAVRNRAALDLAHTVIRAPIAGIAGNTPEIGEQVTGNGPMSKPVMSIVSDSAVWIEANFKETDLTHVAPGQAVTVHVDTYPDRDWHGTVDSISPATGAEFSVLPPQNATGNWVKVVQRIPVRITIAKSKAGPGLRAGMSATVEIDTGHSRQMPGILKAALAWLGNTVAPHDALADEER